jgi:hypothetical protein
VDNDIQQPVIEERAPSSVVYHKNNKYFPRNRKKLI